MENQSMCRICLATDVRLCSIACHLRDMYERITSVTFEREDRRPLVACYICHARLQSCYRLRSSCLQSEELFTEMMSSGELKPHDVLSTNTFRVVSVLHFSLEYVAQDSTKCHVKEEIIHDPEHGQHNTEDDEDVTLEVENTILEETESNVAGSCSQLADNVGPKVVKIELQRIDVNDSTTGVLDSKNNKVAALKDTEGTTANKRKIEVKKNEETENITIKEPKIVTKKTRVEKPTSKILEQLSCNTCKKSFRYKSYLKEHIRTHTGEKPYHCYVCNKCFRRNGDLKIHIRLHTGEKPYACNICKKCFINKRNLKTHILTHTGEKPYVCNICNKCFIKKGSLKTHILTHTGEKPYICDICKKCFIKKGNLKIHILLHTGEKPHACKVCNKCFSQKSHLKGHTLTHIGEKPYACKVCNKCFSQKSHLKRHTLTHTGEKPYHCKVCNKCFSQNSELKAHIRIHTGDKPYVCNYCKKSFIQKSRLKTHIFTHTRRKTISL